MSRLIFFFSIFFVLIPFFSKSTHIIGGNFKVEQILGNDFRVEMYVFRDCINGVPPFDSIHNVHIGLYDLATDTLVFTFNPDTFVYDTVDTERCGYNPGFLCVEEGVYTAEITLPAGFTGYYLIWERCCRNGIVNNVETPAEEGRTFYCEIPAAIFNNNSPAFPPFPTEAFFCIA